MHLSPRHLLAAATLATTALAQAATFDFSGNVTYNTDVIRINFTLATDATDVKVWTDGFQNGLNFDPITAVWSLDTGLKVGENDDNSGIAPGQTYFDSGLTFDSLAAGNYQFTIAAYPNFSVGNSLAEGFVFDNQTPVPIADWCQPASIDCSNQKGTFWRVHLSGVDVATPVPEPNTHALMGLGLLVLGAARWRRRGCPQ